MISALKLFRLSEQLHSFASLQITLPEEITQHCWDLRESLDPQIINFEHDMAKDFECHVTIFYGLASEDLEKIAHHLKDWGSLAVTLVGTVNVFDNNKDYDVLYFPVQCSDLAYMHYGLRSLLNKKPPTYSEYQPHCTLAYVNKDTVKPASIDPGFTSMSCLCSQVEFHYKDEVPVLIPLS